MLPRSILVFVVALAIMLGSCGSTEPSGLDEFATTTITIDDRSMDVAVADTPTKRAHGLMGVTNLGGLEGMVFVFPVESGAGFWMKDTLIPLDIVFFSANGIFVDRFTMQPCIEDPCPSYDPIGLYRYAVEAPAGDLGFVTESSILRVTD